MTSSYAIHDLGQSLRECVRGPLCFMGLGNTDYGDDGFGVCLAEELAEAGVRNVIVAGASPERYLRTTRAFRDLIFLDAVDFGGAPGSVVFLNTAEMAARFPQISTHKMSLSSLAALTEADGTRAWLLGVQPESVKPGQPLSHTVLTTLLLLKDILLGVTWQFERGNLSIDSPSPCPDLSAGPADDNVAEVIR